MYNSQLLHYAHDTTWPQMKMEPNRSSDPVNTDGDSNDLDADNNSDTGPGPSKRVSTYKSEFQKGGGPIVWESVWTKETPS